MAIPGAKRVEVEAGVRVESDIISDLPVWKVAICLAKLGLVKKKESWLMKLNVLAKMKVGGVRQ